MKWKKKLPKEKEKKSTRNMSERNHGRTRVGEMNGQDRISKKDKNKKAYKGI